MIDIFSLLKNTEECCQYLQLHYQEMGAGCIERHKAGKGFWYSCRGKKITNERRLAYFASLAIPPAWSDVYISPDHHAHILVTGYDAEGRKQYIYHPDWLTGREILQFYKLIYFGKKLPDVRRWIEKGLAQQGKEQLLAGMLLTLDTTAIRVGNQNYYDERETVGLTTLRAEHVRLDQGGVTFHFQGKSGQEIHTVAEDPRLQAFYAELLRDRKGFLFPDIGPEEVNDLMCSITHQHSTAKDFRTWGGTVWAYESLVTEKSTPLEAIDHAAELLGNTRSVARTYYIHPHMMEAYDDEKYKRYFYQRRTPKSLLSPVEYNLLRLLKRLRKDRFETEVLTGLN